LHRILKNKKKERGGKKSAGLENIKKGALGGLTT
jgi:hypothetical protein